MKEHTDNPWVRSGMALAGLQTVILKAVYQQRFFDVDIVLLGAVPAEVRICLVGMLKDLSNAYRADRSRQNRDRLESFAWATAAAQLADAAFLPPRTIRTSADRHPTDRRTR